MMAITTEIVDPNALSASRRTALLDELFAVNRAIFQGVERATFERYLLGHGAARARVQIVRAATVAVGYTAIQSYACSLGARRCLVIRSLAGMLPAYRRQTLFGWFMAYEALRLRAANPTTPIYGFACPVHLSTYRMLLRYAVDVWPHPERRTPPELEGLMTELAQHFGLRPDDERSGVCHVGWRTIQDEGERVDWQRSQHPAARYFVQTNPRYQDGYGLLTLVPLRVPRVVQGAAKLLAKRWRKRATIEGRGVARDSA